MTQGLRFGAIGAALVMAAAAASAQTKPSGTKSVTYDITVNADAVYSGTTELSIDRGAVTGNMLLTVPTEITGKVSGTSKAGVVSLDFPYTMTQRNCTGNVKMQITLPPKPGPAKGTMEASGCGRDLAAPLKGTVELTPSSAKKPAEAKK
jgi:hypothetical protein